MGVSSSTDEPVFKQLEALKGYNKELVELQKAAKKNQEAVERLTKVLVILTLMIAGLTAVLVFLTYRLWHGG